MTIDDLLQTAMQRHQAGDLAAAEKIYREVLQRHPEHPLALQMLGVISGQRGQIDSAIEMIRRSIQLNPTYPGAYRNLAPLLAKRRRFDEAIAAYRKYLELRPDVAAVHVALGNLLWQTGRLDEAIATYSAAIRLKPDVSIAYLNLGQVYRSAGRNEDALLAFEQGLKVNADDTEILARIAPVLAELGRYDQALAAHARLASLKPIEAVTFQVLGEILLAQQKVTDAVQHLRRAVELDPKLESAWNLLGLALQADGNFEEAEKCFRHILDSCPGASIGLAYGNLISTGKVSIAPGDVQRLSTAADDPGLDLFDRIGAGFALGKILDEARRYDEAFARYAQANAVLRHLQDVSGKGYQPELVHRQINEMIEAFTAEVFQQRRDWGDPSELPVFIVGMPRTGTTLVHQIAASHPQVHGAGELHEIIHIGLRRGGADAKSALAAWDRRAIRSAAEQHLQFLHSLDPAALRVLDKMPSNIQRLDLIAQLFPAARIIFCRRDPRDTCLSCFFQRFTAGIAFTCDLVHCGYQYLATERIAAHWKKVLPLRMLDVQYEDLVADLEAQSRRIIDFLGLPWDPGCLEFHRSETSVLTASSWQVRQPVYQSSVGRWRNYEKHLGPLLELLSKPLPF